MSAWVPALGAAVLHSLWWGTLVITIGVLVGRLWRDTPAVRYGIEAASLLVVGAVFVTQVVSSDFTAANVLPSGPASWVYPTLAAAWASGASLMSIRLAWAWWGMHRLRKVCLPLGAAWQAQLARMAEALGVGQTVDVAESAMIDSPAVVGWLRPRILLPLALVTRMSAWELEAVLAHELAHVRRYDVAIGILLGITEALVFFHPAVWWSSRRIAGLREHCCDEVAAEHMGDRVGYAKALVALEVDRHAVPVAAMGLGGGGSLRERIERLVAPRAPAVNLRGSVLGVVLVALAITMGLGVMPWSPAPDRSWSAELHRAAARHGVDPDLLDVMMLVESNGNPTARSPMGARGLMQLMPATAEDIAEARGITDHEASALDEPAYNLDFGAYLVAEHLRTFEGDVELAAAAYNGGPTRVRAWLGGQADLSEETHRYKQKVVSMYRARHSETASR